MTNPSSPILLEQQVGSWLIEAGYTLATAESCTGGLIANRLTNISGASGYFLGGVVAYSNALKEALLGVPADILQHHGAVSRECAYAMAAGIKSLINADFGLAVTGIAGPTGGSLEKPVGLVYIAVSTEKEIAVVERQFSGDRNEIKAQTAEAALNLLLEQFERL